MNGQLSALAENDVLSNKVLRYFCQWNEERFSWKDELPSLQRCRYGLERQQASGRGKKEESMDGESYCVRKYEAEDAE